MKFKFLEHTADIKFQAFGKTLKEALENSILAVVETITRKEKIKLKKVKKATIKGKDNENLVYNLIEEILYLLDAEDFVVGEAKIKLDKTKKNMKVEFHGDDSKNYEDLNNIKAVTYNDMFIRKEKGKWIIQVVLDV